MIELHPEILERDGKKQFVVLPYEEFEALQQLLADLEDLRDLRTAKNDEGSLPTLTLEEVKTELGID
jgi:PHD/YefM family antitoxin component YafN of YafNO toxin-antitoxin module